MSPVDWVSEFSSPMANRTEWVYDPQKNQKNATLREVLHYFSSSVDITGGKRGAEMRFVVLPGYSTLKQLRPGPACVSQSACLS
jgi:hypothetical protein